MNMEAINRRVSGLMDLEQVLNVATRFLNTNNECFQCEMTKGSLVRKHPEQGYLFTTYVGDNKDGGFAQAKLNSYPTCISGTMASSHM